MVANISIRVDASEVTEALDELTSRESTSALQKATKKAGNYLAGKARAEAPAKPRKLKRSIRARNARRDKPGTVVSARHPLNPIVQHGTAPRFTRSGAFRGRIEANPFMRRTADRFDREALDIAERELGDQLDL